MSRATLLIVGLFAILIAFPIKVRALDETLLDTLVELPATEVVPASYAIDFGSDKAWRKGKFSIMPYGAFWADMVYATQRTNPGAFTFFVFSEQTQGESAFTIDARRSRFGFNATGPGIPINGGMETGGQLEIDFHGDFILENRAEVLLRQAYWEAKNERHRYLVGQYWDVISPLLPRTLNYSVGWLGGNIGFRRAQFRYERAGSFDGNVSWILQSSLNQDIIPDFTMESGVVRESSSWPVVEARAAITLNPDAGSRATTLGLSGHIGETGFDFLSVGPPPPSLPPVDDVRLETWSFNIDLSIPVTKRTHLQAEFFRGRNLSPFLGGIGQGVCPCTRDTIGSTGGWGDLSYDCSDNVTLHFGYGVDDPDNDDFLFGRTYNQFIFANFLIYLTEGLSTGVELTYWKTLYQDRRVGLPGVPADELRPTAPGKAYVIDWMVKYAF